MDRHIEFWEHIEAIESGIKPPAFFAIWGRGGGKSTNAEAATVRLGAKGVRKFCLYTRSTQDKANESVMNIAAMLESKQVAGFYPELSERKMGKYGNSKGWKVNMLRCANGFNVAALGYDAAVRGIKLEEYRPDVIFIDDIDDKKDTIEVVQKKINTLTRDILPSGSSDVAVIGIQNLVSYGGIFTQIAKGHADFLRDRVVSGPYPAVNDLQYKMVNGKYKITGGTPTWEGQDLATCEAQMNEWGLSAFISEAQLIITRKEGRVYHAFNDSCVGPASSDLDYTQAEGYWHAHDFGSVNRAWALFVRLKGVYYLMHEEILPEGTSAARASRIKAHFAGRKIVAGFGGAASEDQQRLDYGAAGVAIRELSITDVESQVDLTNKMFEKGTLKICSNMALTIDQLENCVRDEKEGIQDKSIWHHLDVLRYFATGVARPGVFVG